MHLDSNHTLVQLMDMTDEPLLSDLCKICSTDTPKYCCPRCNAKTCSLPCYKRHQLLSVCSGKRDRTAYVPKSKLATPAGIDHDYNFLTGIERSVTAASHDLERKGIRLEVGNGWNRPNPESHLQKSIDAAGISIHRAPIGMSRQKNNKTHWHTKQKCIAWTVEWVHPDGTRDHGSCRDNQPIVEAYNFVSKQGKQSRKRKWEDSVGGIQRAAAVDAVAGSGASSHDLETKPISIVEPDKNTSKQPNSSPQGHVTPGSEERIRDAPQFTNATTDPTSNDDIVPLPQSSIVDSLDDALAASSSAIEPGLIKEEGQEEQAALTPQHPPALDDVLAANSSAIEPIFIKQEKQEEQPALTSQQAPALDDALAASSSAIEPIFTKQEKQEEQPPIISHQAPETPDQLSPVEEANTEPLQYFYLHKPLTPGNDKILIPIIESTQPLSTWLRDRELLEYPTIYAMHQAPDDLPDGFRPETDLPRRIQELMDEVAAGEREMRQEASGGRDDVASWNHGSAVVVMKKEEDGEWEEGGVLEALKRDVVGL